MHAAICAVNEHGLNFLFACLVFDFFWVFVPNYFAEREGGRSPQCDELTEPNWKLFPLSPWNLQNLNTQLWSVKKLPHIREKNLIWLEYLTLVCFDVGLRMLTMWPISRWGMHSPSKQLETVFARTRAPQLFNWHIMKNSAGNKARAVKMNSLRRWWWIATTINCLNFFLMPGTLVD